MSDQPADAQPFFLHGHVADRPPTFEVSADCPPGVAIVLHPGASMRLFQDDDGNLTGIVVYHETVDAKGNRFGHENDYFLRSVSVRGTENGE
jgi:hypothetical protein